ncbi:MAG: adenine phosphoribosyltransferase [Deltaproteobacteria bacterium RIFOXYA12_FULL_61_11]|nr:MAG: adenine phosphoribosyltransferase [Deltaproteobacteria bacterium RIFOXYA12_FULL_61_11]
MDLVRSLLRDVPDFPKPGILFKDITPVLAHPIAFRHCIDHFVHRYADRTFDLVVAVESRGFIFGAALALALGKGFIPVRKKGKLPYRTLQQTYALEYGTDTLEIHEDALPGGARVLIVDDLLATGGTARATVELCRKAGGEVIECAFVIELAFLEGRAKLAPLPVHAPLVY